MVRIRGLLHRISWLVSLCSYDNQGSTKMLVVYNGIPSNWSRIRKTRKQKHALVHVVNHNNNNQQLVLNYLVMHISVAAYK